MLLAPTISGFRTLRPEAGHPRTPPGRPGPLPGPRRAAEERWGFRAAVGEADAVFLVLEEEGHGSRWLSMASTSDGRWRLDLPLTGGRLRAKLYAQRGATMVLRDGSDLLVERPRQAAGGVSVEPVRLAWSA